MHSCLVRLQNSFGFFTSVATAMGVIVALTSLLQVQTPSASVSLKGASVILGRPHYYSPTKTEYASLRFDLDADFSSLFGWNTKQVFAWVQATYPSSASNSTPFSQAVIWDTIINSPEQASPPSVWALIGRNAYDSPPPKPAKKTKKKGTAGDKPTKTGVLKLRDERPKYKIPDPSGHIAHLQNVTLQIGWNVQPWVGALAWTNRVWTIGRWAPLQGGTSAPFALPGLKGASASAKKDKPKETVVGTGKKPKAGEAEPII